MKATHRTFVMVPMKVSEDLRAQRGQEFSPGLGTRPQMRSQAGVLRYRWLHADFGQEVPHMHT